MGLASKIKQDVFGGAGTASYGQPAYSSPTSQSSYNAPGTFGTYAQPQHQQSSGYAAQSGAYQAPGNQPGSSNPSSQAYGTQGAPPYGQPLAYGMPAQHAAAAPRPPLYPPPPMPPTAGGPGYGWGQPQPQPQQQFQQPWQSQQQQFWHPLQQPQRPVMTSQPMGNGDMSAEHSRFALIPGSFEERKGNPYYR